MPNIPCLTCKKSGLCKFEGNICMNSLFNWEQMSCDDHDPNFFRGIEGVFALSH